MAEAVTGALLLSERVLTFIDHVYSRPNTVRKDVERARNCFARLQEQWDEGNTKLQAREKQVRDLAHNIEDALDEYMFRVSLHYHTHWISKMAHKVLYVIPDWKASSNLSSSIKDLERDLNLLTSLDSVRSDGPPEGRPSSSIGPQEGTSSLGAHEDHEIVGYEEEKERLDEQLSEANPGLLTIMIVGPGGSGKTTLVKNIYQSERVQNLFHFRAWIDVPPNGIGTGSDHDQLLRKLLRSIEAQRQEVVADEDISNHQAKLRQILTDTKFLVVLDNVGSNEALEFIVNALPKTEGSKLIGTTRNFDVAPVSSKYTHNLSDGLSSKKANQLFCKKAFPDVEENLCPPDLEDWAEKIVKKCEGQPLAISQIGTMLAKTPRVAVEWRKRHESLGSDPFIASSISSYRDLPRNLKQCFLYFGMFPEDETISRERLIRLWVAEGFVRPDDRVQTVEAVAESMLADLIKRNLVVVSAREVDGRVKNCRVSNLVREFIIYEAKHFFTVLEANSVQSIVRDRHSGEKIRRLSVQCDINLLRGIDLRCISHTRTLLVFRQTTYRSELDKVLKACKLLRVFGLQGVPELVKFSESITSHTLLRYLSLRQVDINKVPKSIKELGVLETLELKDTLVTNLPKEIGKLHQLRHLLIYRNVASNNMMFGAAQGVEFSACGLPNSNSLQKLSLIKVNNNRNLLVALGELKDLRRLGVVDLNSEHGRELCDTIQKMENLSTLDVRATSEDEYLELDHMQSRSPPLLLQHLYLKGRLKSVPQWIPQLTSLKKIGLKWSKMNTEPLVALQNLPHLMELDLVDYYTGQELCFGVETFQNLVSLSIDRFDELNWISIGEKAMPRLKKLTISRCQNLKLLPSFLRGDLELLEELLLFDMPSEFIEEFETHTERREDFRHVGVIHYSRHPGSNISNGFKDLSPSRWR